MSPLLERERRRECKRRKERMYRETLSNGTENEFTGIRARKTEDGSFNGSCSASFHCVVILVTIELEII